MILPRTHSNVTWAATRRLWDFLDLTPSFETAIQSPLGPIPNAPGSLFSSRRPVASLLKGFVLQGRLVAERRTARHGVADRITWDLSLPERECSDYEERTARSYVISQTAVAPLVLSLAALIGSASLDMRANWSVKRRKRKRAKLQSSEAADDDRDLRDPDLSRGNCCDHCRMMRRISILGKQLPQPVEVVINAIANGFIIWGVMDVLDRFLGLHIPI